MFIVLVILFYTLPIFNRFMMPKPEDVVEVRPEFIWKKETQSFPTCRMDRLPVA